VEGLRAVTGGEEMTGARMKESKEGKRENPEKPQLLFKYWITGAEWF